MKKMFCLLLLFSVFIHSKAQKNYSLSASGNFDFGTSGLGANDSGVGFSILSNVFTKKKLQLKVDGSLDHCFGDKIAIIDTSGNFLPSSATLIGVRVGPELLITRNISLAALYGYTTYHVYGSKEQSPSYKLAITSYLGKNKRTLFAVNFSKLTGDFSFVHFWGVSIGHKIL